MADLNFWEEVAHERTKGGIDCCTSCAAIGDDLCDDCAEEIDNPKLPRWVADKLARKHPIGWSEVDPAEYNQADISWMYSIGPKFDDRPPWEQWYKDISEYPDKDKPFANLLELHEQAKIYDDYRMEAESPGSRTKRRKVSEGDGQESPTSTEN
jgi:hypothetical protein